MRSDIERLDVIVGGIDAQPLREPEPEAAAPGQRYDIGLEGPAPEEVQQRVVATTLIVLAGLGLGICGLLLAGGGDLGWMLVTIALMISLVVLYKNFATGILVFLSICWIALGTPGVSGTGSGLTVRFLIGQTGLALLMLVWVTRLLARRALGLYPTPITVPMVLHVSICLWSIVNAFVFPDPHVLLESYRIYAQVNYYELAVRILSCGGLLMLANSLQGRSLYRASLIVLAPGIISFSGLLPFLPTTNMLAWPQIFAMTILAAFVATKQGPTWVRAVAGVVAFSIFSAYFFKGTEWVSGWLGAMMGLAVILFITNRRLFWIGCGLLVVIVLARWSYFYQHVYVDNFYAGSLENDRSRMLRAAFLYAAKFPLGVGLGNYRSYNVYYGREDVWNTTTFFSAHGTYAQTLSETGWPGFLTLLLFLAAATRMLYRFWLALPPGYARSYTLGVLGGFVGVYAASFNGDYLFPAYHNGGMGAFGSTVYTFFFVGLAVAMAREHGLVWSELRSLGRGRRGKAVKTPPAPLINRPLRDGGTAPAAAAAAGETP